MYKNKQYHLKYNKMLFYLEIILINQIQKKYLIKITKYFKLILKIKLTNNLKLKIN